MKMDWAFLLFLLATSIYITYHNPDDAALLPGFFVPPVLILYVIYWRKLRDEIPLDLVIKTFAFGFLPGAAVVMILELILAGIFFFVCFNEQIEGWFSALSSLTTMNGSNAPREVHFTIAQQLFHRLHRPQQISRTLVDHVLQAQGGGDTDPLTDIESAYGIVIKRSPGFYLFIALMAYVIAAGTEESLKYFTPLRFQACRNSSSKFVFLVCAVSCALGFSTVENMGYAMGSRGEEGQASLSARAYTAYSRAVVAITAHGVCGGLVGVGLTKKHVLGKSWGFPRILLPSLLVHGTFDFQQLLIAVLVWNVEVQNICVVVLNSIVLVGASVWYAVKGLDLTLTTQTPHEGVELRDDVRLLGQQA
ncbi:hypothetical protein GUITHDRAFT_115711 [Guillardia theta CCMP2712]|uniref:PrsW family intramembrane metalloprotease n=1 Tax=Guillardia theta (strain CCMP2712) TaxID=905079 RepID=L1IQK5_GUITC|nr:hypothetical protein GUITHDRAFT_115711 [Guillardia theta CCMP2712]EKX38164.1 hypothetical protein GUITHDRAFT_115711 [Guillardia theta CCMP2712]|eukprot:XP_005825144.1 hypothetical protein GUITHDRAFT_115711 [Guillardia theta CCMP2712]